MEPKGLTDTYGSIFAFILELIERAAFYAGAALLGAGIFTGSDLMLGLGFGLFVAGFWVTGGSKPIKDADKAEQNEKAGTRVEGQGL